MINGQCPKCSLKSEIDYYICVSCGYVEQYLANDSILSLMTAKWERVK